MTKYNNLDIQGMIETKNHLSVPPSGVRGLNY